MNSTSLREPADVIENRANQSSLVQSRGVKHVRKRTNFANAPVHQGLTSGKKPAGFSLFRRNGTSELTKHGRQSHQVLARTVVQVPGDALSLLILQLQDTTRKMPDFPLSPLYLLDIDARPIPLDNNPLVVTQCHFAVKHPAVFSVRPPHARFILKGFTAG